MFNVLQIQSSTLSLLRCKGCKSIIFRQDSIRQFISYDPNDFDQLSSVSDQLKLEVEANYFVLQPETHYYSSMRINYERVFFTNCHPLFKMRMFKIYCVGCDSSLGYQVCTVNQNTVWMQKRLLIDVQKCSILKDGKDQMSRLIKALKFRLSSKLSTFKTTVQKEPAFNKEKQLIQRLQKISVKTNRSHIQKSDHLKRDKSKLKKGFESIQTTNPSINFVSKADTLPFQNSNFISNIMRNDEVTHGGRSIESTTIVSLQAKNNSEERSKLKEENRQIEFQRVKPKLSLVKLEITESERDQIRINLHMIKENILKISYDLESRAIIVRILNVLTKASVQEKYIYKKIPSQTSTLNNLMTLIRKNFIGDLPSRD